MRLTIRRKILLISALAVIGVTGWVTRPIATLDEAARRVAAGDLETRIEVRGSDEILIRARVRAAALVDEIALLLENDLGRAMDRSEDLGALLSGSAAAGTFRRLERSLYAFDLDGAAAALDGIRSAIS